MQLLTAIIITLVLSGLPKSGRAEDGVLHIPRGPAVILNGQMSAGDWEHAAKVSIPVAKDWNVTIILHHDDTKLYIAFNGLAHAGAERYPEVLLDSANLKPLLWKESQQWWLHASYNLCESDVRPNQYSECAGTKAGWAATRFPLKSGFSEIAISLTKVNISTGKLFGLAFDVTDTKDAWSFWPESAKLNIPMSWGTAVLD